MERARNSCVAVVCLSANSTMLDFSFVKLILSKMSLNESDLCFQMP